MNDRFFVITRDHANDGEFPQGEVGHYALRLNDVILVIVSREEAERMWAGIAHHYGYTYN
jgi:hypothetical protein